MLTSDPCSSADAAQEHPGVQPDAQQPERPLGGGVGPGATVPRGLRPAERRPARRVGESHPAAETGSEPGRHEPDNGTGLVQSALFCFI